MSRRVPELNEKQIEALTVAMIVAPGVYVRNRMFDLFTSAGARRARTRVSIVRGLVAQLARASGVTVASEMRSTTSSSTPLVCDRLRRSTEATYVLRYQITSVKLTRVVDLSAAELAALRVVLDRANVRCLPLASSDKEIVARALARLMDSSEENVSRLARDLVALPTT